MSAHVLIIDDDESIRTMLSAYLRSQDYTTSAAGDGQSGIRFCRETPPDLVVCDLRMPGTDGLHVLSELSESHPELPVIIVSGTADLGDAVQALRLGAWDYVTKPIFDFAVLDHALARALERARLLAENRAYRSRLEATNERLENSLRQLEQDEASGRRIQFTLLPERRVRFGEFECSRFLKTSSFLSGDFTDYFTIDGSRFAIYIADVSGHGVSSAVITVMLKSYVGRHLENYRRYADSTIRDPASLLAAINRDLLASRHGKYLTMFYGVVDLERNWMQFANGGQYPYPWLFDGRDVRQFAGKSPPVGLFEDAEYNSELLALPRKFSLTMFSDGVLELLEGPGLGEKKAAMRRAAATDRLDASGIAAALAIDEDATAPDDASILTLRRLPADA